MSSDTKRRFFREVSDLSSSQSGRNELGDLIFPGSISYVSPFSRHSYSKETIIEVSDDADETENCQIHDRNSGVKYFNSSRRDLPQFFIDSRVQVKITKGMGKGCFAIKDIEKNTIIESAPVILIPRTTFTVLNQHYGHVHKLSEYPFTWGRDGLVAFCLGYGGIYNHKVDPNVVWRPDYESESLLYTVVKDISEGEELFIRYLPVNKLDKLWFEDEESEKYAKLHKNQILEDIPSILSKNRAKTFT